MSEFISAKPNGNAPVATLGIAANEPWPGLISTFKSASAKWPLSIAAKKAADGPSNFQSRANGTVVAAVAMEESNTRPADAAAKNPVFGVKSVLALFRSNVIDIIG